MARRGGRSRRNVACERPPQLHLQLKLRPIGLALRGFNAVIPLLASPQGGEAERVRKISRSIRISRGRDGFPTAHERKTTPSASASVAPHNFLMTQTPLLAVMQGGE